MCTFINIKRLYKLIYDPKKFNKVANEPWTDFDYDVIDL